MRNGIISAALLDERKYRELLDETLPVVWPEQYRALGSYLHNIRGCVRRWDSGHCGRRSSHHVRWRWRRWRPRSEHFAPRGMKSLDGQRLAGSEHHTALIHTAEGEMFRDALVWAAQARDLPVTGVRAKELDASALERIGSFGKLIGPPWTQDQKFATVAAFMALSGG